MRPREKRASFRTWRAPQLRPASMVSSSRSTTIPPRRCRTDRMRSTSPCSRASSRSCSRSAPPRPTRSDMAGSPLEAALRVLQAEADAIRALTERLTGDFAPALDALAACRGKIVVTGIGKSGIICKKIAATLSSTGTPAVFLHSGDALHGDLGQLSRDDVVVAVSKSGETPEILQMLQLIRRLGIPLVALCGNPRSTLARGADFSLDVSVSEEACPLGLAPTTSTAAALAMGDALAMALMARKGFKVEDF